LDLVDPPLDNLSSSPEIKYYLRETKENQYFNYFSTPDSYDDNGAVPYGTVLLKVL
jgi:hypothetical protein